MINLVTVTEAPVSMRNHLREILSFTISNLVEVGCGESTAAFPLIVSREDAGFSATTACFPVKISVIVADLLAWRQLGFVVSWVPPNVLLLPGA